MAKAAPSPSPLRRTIDHYASIGITRPWTAKLQRSNASDAGLGVPSLLEMCTDAVAQHLHTLPSLEVLPHHLMKDVLDRYALIRFRMLWFVAS